MRLGDKNLTQALAFPGRERDNGSFSFYDQGRWQEWGHSLNKKIHGPIGAFCGRHEASLGFVPNRMIEGRYLPDISGMSTPDHGSFSAPLIESVYDGALKEGVKTDTARSEASGSQFRC